ncbi:MAG: 23S rRNA (adenine(2030)-N(6))-methyltransferase RlmJ [Phenylobacterium sp.]|uniref:23S rRNA (adenine(2030)-N(6))-methyltransferase RlmJ n=1 Tax=Phenylobacterium sp. TaxID=1871053 RepID=UPI001B4A900B|nr:23S rRNA (adenine(2030)-N(6))-methyltransferase RlmJ [Phenylobacterium sp.]MBP7651318.1 23S rRNA (adenine(2030)-N(6))-methyltransferase RlmJ [Phenylobacterium sp.]MBP7817508.1 23S rRNA (adenine(2030)-N(6))-methyltransferase RlmJ [Phenylobacterium sp.]MBP9230244.1 23S rRNA (adenine(2030)-N(6))-methyltransferase RlmJ [Phenylobacterium sp.]MBP9753849.1 23S rRNA (adenine(2030)-N(6))-methyltransferase RlmJ [Phenylobacterium sp.]
MNYRHAFHAGNFADLVKHAALLRLMATLTKGAGSLTVIDTHAGRGLYDLSGAESQRSGEAQAGIAQLMKADDLPAAFGPLRAAVNKLNNGGVTRFYPGSPRLIADTLRKKDVYIACELRGEEHAALRMALKGRTGIETLCADGYDTAVARCPPKGPVLVLIDPPFERPDDYTRIVATLKAIGRRNREAVVMIWLPIKDLQTFDHFLNEAQDTGIGPLLVGECRMRPLADPMKMNGCALVTARAPADFAASMEEMCRWTAQTLGQNGQGRVSTLS